MPTTSAEPGKSVPGALAERRRMTVDDTRGVTFYALAVAAISVVVVAIVMVA